MKCSTNILPKNPFVLAIEQGNPKPKVNSATTFDGVIISLLAEICLLACVIYLCNEYLSIKTCAVNNRRMGIPSTRYKVIKLTITMQMFFNNNLHWVKMGGFIVLLAEERSNLC